MKKIVFGALALAAVAMVACSKSNDSEAANGEEEVVGDVIPEGDGEYQVDVEGAATDTLANGEVQVVTEDQVTEVAAQAAQTAQTAAQQAAK